MPDSRGMGQKWRLRGGLARQTCRAATTMVIGACLVLTGCGGTHGAATMHVAAQAPLPTAQVQTITACSEAQRELDVILRHGVDPSPTVLPTEIPRTAKESLPVIDALLVRLRQIGDGHPSVRRALRNTEQNRSAIAKLAKPRLVGADSGMQAIYRSDAACVRPRIGS